MRKLFKFSLDKGKLNEETERNFQAFMNSKKNSCRGNYMRKYGIYLVFLEFDHKRNWTADWSEVPKDRPLHYILVRDSRKNLGHRTLVIEAYHYNVIKENK